MLVDWHCNYLATIVRKSVTFDLRSQCSLSCSDSCNWIQFKTSHVWFFLLLKIIPVVFNLPVKTKVADYGHGGKSLQLVHWHGKLEATCDGEDCIRIGEYIIL